MMRAEEFVVWVKGFLAATGPTWTPEQAQIVKDHADLVMVRGPVARADMQAISDAVDKRAERVAQYRAARKAAKGNGPKE